MLGGRAPSRFPDTVYDHHRRRDGRLRRPLGSFDQSPPELVLTLSPGPDDDFLVHARSPQGEAQARFRLPWERTGSRRLRDAVQRCPRHVSTVGGAAGVPAPPFDLRREGSRLFAALFEDGEVLGLYRSTRTADPQGRLRLRLVLDPDLPRTGPLHETSWELLLDPDLGELLALAEGSSVVRTLMVARPPRAFEPVSRLRVLVLLSGAPDLDLERERREIEGLARRLRGLQVSCAPATDLDGLEALLRDASRDGRPFHVLHLAGHGEVASDPEEGALVWNPPDGPPHRLSGRRLATLLSSFPELQMVVLNACTTAELPTEGGDPFAGVASALLKRGVPIVVAVQGAIRDEAAIAFARAFYGALARRATPEAALTAARWALWKSDPEEIEWVKPVLFRAAPRPGLPRWLRRAAAVLVATLLLVSGIAAAQTHRVATRAMERSVEEAQVLLLDHRPAAAMEVIETALARSHWPPVARKVRAPAHATAALAAEDLGDLAAAVEHAGEAARLEPDRAVHHYNLGALLARSGRPGEAVPPLRRALELDPTLADAANELGCIHLDLERPGDARRVLEAAVASHPEHPLLHKNLGRALLALGRPGEAARSLERARDLLPLGDWPARAEASFQLARATAEQGDAERACEALARFEEADPQAVTRFAPDAARLAETIGCLHPSASPGGSRGR